MSRLFVFLFPIAFFLSSPTLQAHNVVAGAYVDGMQIEGEIAFSNGETALPDVLVEVFNASGDKIGETRTETEGLFTFTAIEAQKHTFKADLGAGHLAEIVVEADEFADSSAVPEQTKADKPVTQQVEGISMEELESIVRHAVAQQVKPLQKELRAYKEKVMLRDIAGELGFIFGFFGVAAWMAARKQGKTTVTPGKSSAERSS